MCSVQVFSSRVGRTVAWRQSLIVCQQKQQVQWRPAKVVQRQLVAKDKVELHSLQLNVSEQVSKLHTKAGQFIQIRVNESKPGFFAISNAPRGLEDSRLDFLIKCSGETAEALCSDIDQVEVSDIMGNGFKDTEQYSNIVLFATGTGIAPIKALIESGALGKEKDIRLYYGAYNPMCMAYQDSFSKWQDLGVNVVPVYSEKEGKYVQDMFKSADNANIIQNPDKSCAVVVGQKDMFLAVVDVMNEFGVSKEQIITNF